MRAIFAVLPLEGNGSSLWTIVTKLVKFVAPCAGAAIMALSGLVINRNGLILPLTISGMMGERLLLDYPVKARVGR